MGSISNQKWTEFLADFPRATPLSFRDSLPFSLFSGGIPRGALTELSSPLGCGKTEVVLKFLAEHPELSVLWIEQEFTFYPNRMLQERVSLNRVLFVESSEGPWVALQGLKAQIFEVVVLNSFILSETNLRRLQIATKRAGSIVFLLSEQRTQCGAWAILLQLGVEKQGGQIQLSLEHSLRSTGRLKSQFFR